MQTDISAKEAFYAEAEQFLKLAIEVEEQIEKRNELAKRIESASMRRDELANALRNRLDKMQEQQIIVFAGCVVIVAVDGAVIRSGDPILTGASVHAVVAAGPGKDSVITCASVDDVVPARAVDLVIAVGSLQ